MKIVPYLNFNGNCAKAIAFYEKIFGVKAETCFYKDISQFDPTFKVKKGQENWVMHSCMKIAAGVEIQFADCEDNGKNVGTNICLQLTYETAEQVLSVFKSIKACGKIICDAAPTFYAPLYAELVDKFGIRWSIMQASAEK